MGNGPHLGSGSDLDCVRDASMACSLLKRPEHAADLFGNEFILTHDPVDDAQDQESIIRDPHGVAKIFPSPGVLNDLHDEPISPASVRLLIVW